MKIKRAKIIWADKSVYSFTIENGYNDSITYTRNKISYSQFLSNKLEQIKDDLYDMSFEKKFWKARDYALKLHLDFSYERKII